MKSNPRIPVPRRWLRPLLAGAAAAAVAALVAIPAPTRADSPHNSWMHQAKAPKESGRMQAARKMRENRDRMEIKEMHPDMSRGTMTITTWPYEEKPELEDGQELGDLVEAVGFQVETTGLNDEARGALMLAARDIRRDHDAHVLVVGEADGFAEKDRAQALSRERADRVRGFLVDHGVPRSKIEVQVLGVPERDGRSEFALLSPEESVQVWAVRSKVPETE
jgi:outer membrane protein OmpA-like peptidoglycan-associated protein